MLTKISTMKKNNKAVYLHISKNTNKVIYIGAGEQTKRPYDFYQRSKEHKAYIEKYGVTVKIVQDNLSIEKAAKLEDLLIKQYSKIDRISLFNTKGGGGGMNPLSKETRTKIGETRRQKRLLDPNYGKSTKKSAYVESLTILTDEQIKAIIEEINERLPIEGNALELDADIASRYDVQPSTIWDVRTRKHRYAKYPQTITRYKVSKAWGWRLLEDGEVEFKNKKKGSKKVSTKKGAKRPMKRIK